jgi:hypothetical protein
MVHGTSGHDQDQEGQEASTPRRADPRTRALAGRSVALWLTSCGRTNAAVRPRSAAGAPGRWFVLSVNQVCGREGGSGSILRAEAAGFGCLPLKEPFVALDAPFVALSA